MKRNVQVLTNGWHTSFGFLGTTDDLTPEPATMSLLGLGALALLRRRRRKS